MAIKLSHIADTITLLVSSIPWGLDYCAIKLLNVEQNGKFYQGPPF